MQLRAILLRYLFFKFVIPEKCDVKTNLIFNRWALSNKKSANVEQN